MDLGVISGLSIAIGIVRLEEDVFWLDFLI